MLKVIIDYRNHQYSTEHEGDAWELANDAKSVVYTIFEDLYREDPALADEFKERFLVEVNDEYSWRIYNDD